MMWYLQSPPPDYCDLVGVQPASPALTATQPGDDYIMMALSQIVQLLTAILAAIERR